ncbi:glycosyl hydrolase [Spirosoma sp. 209]|uniref:glycosyl hydrolase n=1 Tax=Spirosoma sp. 209 TaxID=1955701 RepID=UPI00098D443B|nr:glycosyl hydrolase [Spirosoma sp. 209]
MDISSKYFALLRQPDPLIIKRLWDLAVDLYRVGKLRESVSFLRWEIVHRLRLFRLGNRYVSFTDQSFFSITNDRVWLRKNTAAGSVSINAGLSFRAVPVDWKYSFQATDGRLYGCLFSRPNALVVSVDRSQSVEVLHEFQHPIASLFVSRNSTLFVCVKGVVYQSRNGGLSFRPVLNLSTPISYFLFNNGMTELPDHTLLLGEYGSIWHGRSWQNLAYVYSSVDGGETWTSSDFLQRQGVNKHVHLVRYSATAKTVFLTDGDNKKQIWSNRALVNESTGFTTGWQLINRYHHQTGGYLSMAETQDAVVFGSDYLGGTNFIVRTVDGVRFEKLTLPDPYRRSPVMNLVTRQGASGSELWATTYSCLSSQAKSLLMCSYDSGKTWTRVIEFDGASHEIRLVSSSQTPSDDLYISITEFDSLHRQQSHRVYRLECDSTPLVQPN